MTTKLGADDRGLRVINLVKHFPLRRGLPWSKPDAYVRAVDDVSFDVEPHETVSLVGESGCGKTTTARLVLLLEHPTSGRICFRDKDINTLRGADLRRYRASVQAVFQDPGSSMNPRMRAKDIISEPLYINQGMPRREREERASDLLEAVGLERSLGNDYPHEFSGGMRQRLAVARALSLNPSLIVLDEPVSALDVSIRAQIMNLLKDLQERLGVAYLLVAHDLATVRYLSHRLVVMYLGEIVEVGLSEAVFANALHPYTQALISAALPARPGEQSAGVILSVDLPSPTDPPPGCRFHTRCPLAFDRCRAEKPALRELTPGRKAACHLY
jgi:oligopeptide/dipeptide ABC transporter ATP-binding protein